MTRKSSLDVMLVLLLVCLLSITYLTSLHSHVVPERHTRNSDVNLPVVSSIFNPIDTASHAALRGSTIMNADDDNYALANNESLGFFNDISSKEWTMLKANSKNRNHHSISIYPRRKHRKPNWYYAENWDPDFACRFEFEKDLIQVAPNCQIHVLDPLKYSQESSAATTTDKQGLGGGGGVHFHSWGLRASYETNANETAAWHLVNLTETNPSTLTLKTLAETVETLGHVGRRIDVLKIDCDGFLWSLYKDFLKQDIRQILIETHGNNEITIQFFQELHDHGYVVFHKEPNIQWAVGTCAQFSFLKLSKLFFL